MSHRLLAVPLAVLLAAASLAGGLCPSGGCPLTALRSMDCCERGGWTQPSCCDRTAPVDAVVAGPVVSVRTADGVAVSPLPAGLVGSIEVTPLRLALPRPRSHSLAPPGTLIAQHTALLL